MAEPGRGPCFFLLAAVVVCGPFEKRRQRTGHEKLVSFMASIFVRHRVQTGLGRLRYPFFTISLASFRRLLVCQSPGFPVAVREFKRACIDGGEEGESKMGPLNGI